MKSLSSIPTVLVSLALVCLPIFTTADPIGVQSNFGAITYAGGMAYDSAQDIVYTTGQVGANGCFVGVLQRESLQYISKLELPEPAICQAIASHPHSTTTATAWALAIAEEGGLFTDTRATGSTKATQYGLVVPLTWTADGSSAKMPTGLLLHEDVTQYPRTILADPSNVNTLYVASLHSESGSMNADFDTSEAVPNQTPGGVLHYGSNYFLQVERLIFDPLSTTTSSVAALDAEWRKPFGVQAISASDQSTASIHLANMIYVKGALVLAGSTRGTGPAFGESASTVMSGFVTKFDPNTGRTWTETSPSVQRYHAKDDAATYIEAICSGDVESDSVYIVGLYTSATGTGSTKNIPYLVKLNVKTLEAEWEEEFIFTEDAYGLACGVDEDSGLVYMAGIVENGGTYGSETSSLGLDDIFVVQADVSDGHANWVRQLGTQGNDRLAHGGNGLAIVPSTGVLLMGDTSGDFAATNQKGTEMFVVQVSSDGTVPSTTETSGTENIGGSMEETEPEYIGGDQNTGGTTDDDDEVPTPAPTKDSSSPISKRSGTGGGVGKMAAIVILAIVLVSGYIMSSRKKEKITERSVVFSYLHSFDLEDVDVRHSATGGWHGTYVGKLANGQNGRGNMSGMSHSSIVKDSLFVDYDAGGPAGNSSVKPFEIGAIDDSDEDEDFEEIGQLENSMNQGKGGSSSEGANWGSDII